MPETNRRRTAASRWFALSCVVAALSCGGPPTQVVEAPSAGQAVAAPDPAQRLADALPRGALRCAVVRPGRVSQRRRSLLRRLSQGGPLAWGSAAPFAALAWAERAGEDGHKATFLLLRVAGTPASVRDYLERRAPVHVVFGPQPTECSDGACQRMHGRFVDAHTVLLTQGIWPEDVSPGAEEHCRRLVGEEPRAIEVAAGPPTAIGTVDGILMPLRSESVLRLRDRGVLRERRQVLPSSGAAERALAGLRRPVSIPVSVLETVFDGELVRRGRVVVGLSRIPYEDLELLAGDDQRLRRALLAEERASLPLPVESVDLTDHHQVLEQVQRHRRRLERSPDDAREPLVLAYRALLEGALSHHPDDAALLGRHAALLLEHAREYEAAAAAYQRLIDAGYGDLREHAMRRREAYARGGGHGLAAALVADGVLPSSAAARATADLVALVADGESYALAESAVLVDRKMQRALRSTRPRRVGAAALPLESLLETLVALAHEDRVARSAHVRVVGASSHDGRVRYGGPDSRLVTLRGRADRAVLVGAAPSSEPSRLRRLGAHVATAVADGPVEVSVAIIAYDSPDGAPLALLRVHGEVSDGELVLTHAASSGAPRYDWAQVERLLARPLLSMEARVFPPPGVEVRFVDEASAAAYGAAAAEEHALRCDAEEAVVRCSASPDRLDATQALLRLADGALRRGR